MKHSVAVMLAAIALTLPRIALSEEAHHQGAATLGSGSQLLGEPWDEKAGRWRGRTFFSYLDSSSRFDEDGDRTAQEANGRFVNLSLNLFGEYAWSDRWSASALLPLQYSRLKNNAGTDRWTSLGDTYGWIRYRFDEVSHLTPALLAGVKIPGTYQDVSDVGVGDGQVDVEMQGLATRRFQGGHYLSANSGYRYRTEAIADQIILGVQGGWAPAPRWLVAPALNGAKGVGAGTQKDFVNAGLTVFWSLTDAWRLLISYNTILAGKNTVDADVWSLGVSYQ